MSSNEEIDAWRELVDESIIYTEEKLANEFLICECCCVSAEDFRKTFQTLEDVDLEVMKRDFQMATGCKSCLKTFEDLKHKIY
jgi:NAD(P)H-nitrite reductase large subunit